MSQQPKDPHQAYHGVSSTAPCSDQNHPCVATAINKEEPLHGILFHYQACTKSCAVVELLMAANVHFDVIDYMNYPPSMALLEALLDALKLPAHALLRMNEPLYASLQLNEHSDETTILSAIQTNPILMQRPIFWLGQHAVIGRPPEQVLTLIGMHAKR